MVPITIARALHILAIVQGDVGPVNTKNCIDFPPAACELGCWRCSLLFWLRNLLPMLIAVAIALAPMGAAWAGGAKGTSGTVRLEHGHLDDHGSGPTASPMEDCTSRMQGTSDADDGPCCANDPACPADICATACFQLVGIAQQPRLLGRLSTPQTWPVAMVHSPDWSDGPQPRPPRT